MNKRMVYTSQFKHEAVGLLETWDMPASDAARQPGVRRNQLDKWKEQLSKGGAKAFRRAGRREGVMFHGHRESRLSRR